MTRHAIAQFGARADEAGFRGGDGNPQLLSDIAHGQALDVAKEHDVAHQAGDSSDLQFEDLSELRECQFPFGIGVGGRELNWDGPRLGGRFIEVDEVSAAPDAHEHEALIGDDAGQPRREFGIALVLVEVLVGFEDCVLRLIFGVAAIAEKEAAQVHTFVPMPLDEFSEGRAVSAACQVH